MKRRIVSLVLAVLLILTAAPPNVAATNTPLAQINGFIASVEDIIPSNAIYISTEEQLSAIGGESSAGKYYVLENDIMLMNNWTPLTNFCGTLDGQGYVIGGLRVYDGVYVNGTDTKSMGLFATVGSAAIEYSGVTIKNLGVEIEYTGPSGKNNWIGSIVGSTQGSGSLQIENCYATGRISNNGSGNSYTGGMVGISTNYNLTIKDSYTQLNISNSAGSGGLLGVFKYGTITVERCYATGDTYSSGISGGLVANIETQSNITIENSYTTGTIHSEGESGGIVAKSIGNIIVIKDCYAAGTVKSNTRGAGGISQNIFANGYVTIINCYVTGNVSGTNYEIGGLIGLLGTESDKSTVANCYVTGSVFTSTSNYISVRIGGLIGSIEGSAKITRCYTTGNVSASTISSAPMSIAGGLIGECYASGGNTIAISNCYALGNVSASTIIASPANVYSVAGALVGYAGNNGGNISIFNCYAIGNAFATVSSLSASSFSSAGGILGENNEVTVRGCYRLDTQEVSGGNINSDGISLTSDQMKMQMSFQNWNFITVWKSTTDQNNGYPVLHIFDSNFFVTDVTSNNIDYNVEDVIVPGSVNGFEINLTQETITIPEDFMPLSYSIDNGGKWRAFNAGIFSDTRFPRLFNKDFTLLLSNKTIDTATKKPYTGADAVTVSFARINRRQSPPKVSVNYLIGADMTGETTGDWVLVERGSTTVVKDGILIGMSAGRVVDEKGFGKFPEGNRTGLSLELLTGSSPTRTVYFVKYAPKKSGTTYTAASKQVRVTVTGERNPIKFKVRTKSEKRNKDGTINRPASAMLTVRANTYVSINGNAPQLYTTKQNIDLLDFTGNIQLWTPANSRRAATSKFLVSR